MAIWNLGSINADYSEAETGDWFITQNETNLQRTGAQLARKMGLKVAYAAAPFDAERVQAVLEQLDFLILNAVEAWQLKEATGLEPDDAVGRLTLSLTCQRFRRFNHHTDVRWMRLEELANRNGHNQSDRFERIKPFLNNSCHWFSPYVQFHKMPKSVLRQLKPL